MKLHCIFYLYCQVIILRSTFGKTFCWSHEMSTDNTFITQTCDHITLNRTVRSENIVQSEGRIAQKKDPSKQLQHR